MLTCENVSKLYNMSPSDKMSQERYTYKQILLEIRNEHLQLNKQLEELKAYIKVFDKHVIDCFFRYGILQQIKILNYLFA